MKVKIKKIRSNKVAQKLWKFNDKFYGLVGYCNCSDLYGQEGWDITFGTNYQERDEEYNRLYQDSYCDPKYSKVSCLGLDDFADEIELSEKPFDLLANKYGISLSRTKTTLYVVDNQFLTLVHNIEGEEIIDITWNIQGMVDFILKLGYIPESQNEKLKSKFRKMFKLGYSRKIKRKKRRYQ